MSVLLQLSFLLVGLITSGRGDDGYGALDYLNDLDYQALSDSEDSFEPIREGCSKEEARIRAKVAIEKLGLDPKMDPEQFEVSYYRTAIQESRSSLPDGGTVDEILAILKQMFEANKDSVLAMLFQALSLEENFLCDLETSPVEQCWTTFGCFNRKTGLMKHLCRLPEHKLDVKYFLFTADNRDMGVEQTFANLELIDGSQPIAFVIHGFMKDSKIPHIVDIKNELLASGDYRQVILVDYGFAVRRFNYVRAMANAELVGRQFGYMLQYISVQRRLPVQRMYIIGFSMGCQVAHFASKWVQDVGGVRPGRITALDPAAVLVYGYANITIEPSDADFVDVIHTSAGYDRVHPLLSALFQRIGLVMPVGHVDFYPNGGGFQPQCGFFSRLHCKHRSAPAYFVQSFRKCQFTSKSCEFVDPFENIDYCKGKSEAPGSAMGYHAIKHRGRGSQVVATAKDFPYC